MKWNHRPEHRHRMVARLPLPGREQEQDHHHFAQVARLHAHCGGARRRG